MTCGVPMPIQHIHVENFKSFSELDIELSRFNVVIGSNAAGKSNFISIFKFLRDIAKHGVVNAIAMQGGPEYLQNTKIGPQKDLQVRVVYLPDQKSEITEHQGKDSLLIVIKSCLSSYEFTLRFASRGEGFSIIKDRIIIGCEVSSRGHENAPVIENQVIGNGEIRVTNDGGNITYEVDLPEGCPLSEQDIIPLCFRGKHLPEKTLLLETPYAYPLSPGGGKFFDRIAVYDIDPKLMKKGIAITGRRELEEDAGNLVLVLKNIIGDPEKKRKFSNLLRDVLPFIEDFSVEKFMDISLILTLREKYSRDHSLPSPSLSDGTLTIFALIIALYFEKKPFIIIEEPVSHIHPFLVARVISMMKESSKRKQVMITTHTTEVVKHASIEHLLLVSRDSEGFSVLSRPADKEEVRTFLENEIGIEELYVQNLLGL
jgi:predicted ATPase